MPLEIHEHVVSTPHGDRVAMVVSPRGDIRIGLGDVPTGEEEMSQADQRILAEAKARVPRVELCIFRGTNDDGTGSWSFDPALDEAGCHELARRLLPGQTVMYRAMLRVGLTLFAHTEWGLRELDAYRRAIDERLAELSTLAGGTGTLGQSEQAIDLWLLRNLTFFFTLSFDKFVETVLPDKLRLMDRRMERIRRMLNLPRPAGRR